MKTRANPAAGFTLIELMIAIVIGTILLSIAVPSYMSQVRKSRRTEAKTAILDLAGREERLFSTTNTYSQTPADLGYPGWGQPMGGGYYTLNVVAPNPPGTTFTITATAFGTQVKDTQCRKFTVDQTGQRFAYDANNVDTSAICFN